VSFAAAHAQVQRAITPIKGDLYRFRNAGHFSVFLVTPAGISATDPIDADAARWLKAELAQRFAKPVKYLIYSHDHSDHISGGEVFADTAVVIAHENAKSVILGERRPTAVPDLTFSDRLTVELGGKKVELLYLGKNHSDNSIVMRFPDERALFAVDFIPVKSLPFRDCPDGYIDEWIESLKKAETLDFDILAPGHGELTEGRRAQLRAYSRRAARTGPRIFARRQIGGRNQATGENGEVRGLGQLQNYLPLNIEGMARHLQMHRLPN
jgi:glyoxylase-like metal-dependent hydrolase (beta-lactamase superfamily II)